MVVVGLSSDRETKKSTVQVPFSIDGTRTGSKLYWFSVWVVFCSLSFLVRQPFFLFPPPFLPFFRFNRLLDTESGEK